MKPLYGAGFGYHPEPYEPSTCCRRWAVFNFVLLKLRPQFHNLAEDLHR